MIYRERSLLPAAIVQAALYNVNNDWEKRPEGWKAADFMPGANVQTREEELREWAEAIERGETFETDPEEIARFKSEMEDAFSNVKPSSQPSVSQSE